MNQTVTPQDVCDKLRENKYFLMLIEKFQLEI